jgi:hypothetical protein
LRSDWPGCQRGDGRYDRRGLWEESSKAQSERLLVFRRLESHWEGSLAEMLLNSSKEVRSNMQVIRKQGKNAIQLLRDFHCDSAASGEVVREARVSGKLPVGTEWLRAHALG